MTNLFAQVPGLIRRSPLEGALVAILIIIVSYIIVPFTAGAKAGEPAPDRGVALSVAAMQNQTATFGQLPTASLVGPFYTKEVMATAYNSLPWQTDDTPFITASGTPVRHGVVAANFLPIGTEITIPDLYGEQIFVVEDRMNPRYAEYVDIWMKDLEAARRFGRRSVVIHVYTGGD